MTFSLAINDTFHTIVLYYSKKAKKFEFLETL